MAAPKKKSTKSATPHLTPDGIMQLGLGFWGSAGCSPISWLGAVPRNERVAAAVGGVQDRERSLHDIRGVEKGDGRKGLGVKELFYGGTIVLQQVWHFLHGVGVDVVQTHLVICRQLVARRDRVVEVDESRAERSLAAQPQVIHRACVRPQTSGAAHDHHITIFKQQLPTRDDTFHRLARVHGSSSWHRTGGFLLLLGHGKWTPSSMP
jgi:hypothetical protein